MDFWSVVTPSVKKPRVRANPRCMLLSVSASGGPYQAIPRWKTDIATAMTVTKTFKGFLMLIADYFLISSARRTSAVHPDASGQKCQLPFFLLSDL